MQKIVTLCASGLVNRERDGYWNKCRILNVVVAQSSTTSANADLACAFGQLHQCQFQIIFVGPKAKPEREREGEREKG